MNLHPVELIELPHEFHTVCALVPTPERQVEFAVCVVTPREPTPDRARPTANYLGRQELQSTAAKDIADATWEDAEWQ
ncbi:MAG: hypothetical protein M3451_06740 [Chloroflexota bacterium]|nr:hypothetical protein [Chloroflexota bacterium]